MSRAEPGLAGAVRVPAAPPAPDRPAGPPGDAGASRSRRLATGILTAVLSRGVGQVVPLVLIPVTLSYLGPQRYGLWMSVVALTAMAAFADLGLGTGLMTKLAGCYATGDTARARSYVSTAYCLLGTLAAVACALLWSVSPVVPWSAVFNVTDELTPAETRAMVLVWLTAFVVNIPLSLVNRVQYAYQQVGQSNVWLAVGSLVTLPLVLLVVGAGLPPVAVVAVMAAAPLLVTVVNTVWVYWWRMPQLRPRPSAVDRRLAGGLLRISGLFFAVTIVMAVANNVDNLIIAHTLGLASTTAFAIPAKLMMQLGGLMVMVNMPLWAANGEALARGDVAWVRRTARRMTLLSIVSILLPSTALVAFGDRLFAAWLPYPLGGDRWLLVGLALWWLLLSGFSPLMMVQNAAGVVRPQLVGLVVYLGLSVPGKWYGATAYGLTAIPFVGVACYAFTVLPAGLLGYRRALARYASPAVPGRDGGEPVGVSGHPGVR
ncbi:lipopolysaccharide biosynthesis protein [Micromonospora sp. NPDC048830]|uniref:lipopolysaccharide biosynthesis protein n=1 Tax=Micromonospora sp. NPDC048830 TaxID=3364257 RepID=UPI00371C67F9